MLMAVRYLQGEGEPPLWMSLQPRQLLNAFATHEALRFAIGPGSVALAVPIQQRPSRFPAYQFWLNRRTSLPAAYQSHVTAFRHHRYGPLPPRQHQRNQ